MTLNKHQLLAQLPAVFDRWQAFLSQRSEDQIVADNPAGMSIKDTIAHLHAWQQLSIARLEAAQRGDEPILPDWVTGPDPDDEALLEVFNARIQDSALRQPWPRVHEQWQAGFQRLLELAESSPEGDLMAAGRYPWLRGNALSDVLTGWLEHHAEHLQDLTGAPES